MGLETAFPVLYTCLVKTGYLSMERLRQLLVDNPRARFGIPMGECWSVWDLDEEWTVEPEKFQSMGKATPFAGWKLYGKCVLTVCDGKIVYRNA